VIAIPGDIALRHAVTEEPRLHFPPPKPTICPAEDEIETLAKVLNKSDKVTILGGAGCAGAHAELVAVARKLNAPIVHALRGKEFIEYDNPFDVGMTGLLGFSSGYFAMMNCNTLLMIGTDFPYQQLFPEHATIIQIDIRGEQLGRRTKLDYGLVGDTKATLQALLPKPKQNSDDKHLRKSWCYCSAQRLGRPRDGGNKPRGNISIRRTRSAIWQAMMPFSHVTLVRPPFGRRVILG
jgi:pyruvate dehydrogenase (quinone)